MTIHTAFLRLAAKFAESLGCTLDDARPLVLAWWEKTCPEVLEMYRAYLLEVK